MYDVNPISDAPEPAPFRMPQADPVQVGAQRTVAFFLIFATLAAFMSIQYDRMYWPYMASAYLLGMVVYVWEKIKYPDEKKPSLLGYLFPASSWYHRSSVQDCLVSLMNFIFIGYIFNFALFDPTVFGEWMKSATNYLAAHSGMKPGSNPGVLPIAILTVSSLISSEFFDYWSHRMLHKVPALWEFHKVHHSAQVLTPLTTYRLHPFDVWYTMAFRAVGVGLPAGVFLYLYPDLKGVATVAGLNVIIFTAHMVGANLRHSHIWLRFHPSVERFIVSPVMHQIHHSASPKHFDKNFGTHLTIWDWVFGSLYIPQKRETLKFGLGDAKMEEPYLTFWSSFIEPFRQLGKWFR